MSELHHSVYVIELDKEVLNKKKFREENPNYIERMPCVYVGMTGLDVDERFENHKAGIKSSRMVKNFGKELIPELYEEYNPMDSWTAPKKERELAEELRSQGYGVWQK
jgi:hypothetical protein